MSDDIISSLDEMIQRWCVAEREVNFLGHKHRQSPSFISIIHKDITSRDMLFLDGGFAVDSVNNEKDVFADMYFGEDQKFGRGMMAITDVPVHSTALKRNLDRVLDSTLKLAVEHYSSLVGYSQTLREKSNFYKLSEEEVVKSISSSPQPVNYLLSDDNIKKIEKFTDVIFQSPWIEKVNTSIHLSDSIRRFVNSEGTKIKSSNFRGSIVAGVLIRNGKSEMLEYYDPLHYFISPQEIKEKEYYDGVFIEKFLNHIAALANSRPVETGEYPVILDGAATGVFFHEAIAAHLLSGRYIYKKISNVFADKIGKQIMPGFLNIIDDPTYKEGFGHYVYDEEGVKGQKTVLVESGVLKTLLLDRASAGYLGLKSNGHSRGEGFIGSNENEEFIFTYEPRISNLFIESSYALSEGDLIKMMQEYCERTDREFGLYIKSGTGEVNVKTGQFFLYPKEAYKIYTDGKVELTSGISLMGDPHSLLNEIVACSDKYTSECGVCGAHSGMIPAWEQAPSAFFENVVFNKEIRTQVTDRTIPKYI